MRIMEVAVSEMKNHAQRHIERLKEDENNIEKEVERLEKIIEKLESRKNKISRRKRDVQRCIRRHEISSIEADRNERRELRRRSGFGPIEEPQLPDCDNQLGDPRFSGGVTHIWDEWLAEYVVDYTYYI